MSRKKAYVSPRVIRVKLEPTQAVLSQCSVGIVDIRLAKGPASFCEVNKQFPCKQFPLGDSQATS
jgi:hypothetical protein